MATIKVEVEFEGLENSQLDWFNDRLYEFLAKQGRQEKPPFEGTVVNVAELDREEDDNVEEETEAEDV